jgi:hypothetical protein
MKTAMQELIEWSYENDKPDCSIEAYDIIKKAKDLLEKEKEQIIEARENGLMDGIGDYVLTEWGKDSELLTSKEYYNQTYNL